MGAGLDHYRDRETSPDQVTCLDRISRIREPEIVRCGRIELVRQLATLIPVKKRRMN
jgi:hypothetical protein